MWCTTCTNYNKSVNARFLIIAHFAPLTSLRKIALTRSSMSIWAHSGPLFASHGYASGTWTYGLHMDMHERV